jgi:7-cyano-7-deazaguanine synthase
MNMTLAASMVPVKIEAPLVRMNKKQIVEEAVSIHMDIDKAWSCYESVNFNKPCGLCHSCKERIDAGA